MSDTTRQGIDTAVSEWLAFVVREDGPESAAGLTLLALNTLTARLADVERERDELLAAAREVVAALDNDEFDTSNIVVETVLVELANAVHQHDLDALTAAATEEERS